MSAYSTTYATNPVAAETYVQAQAVPINSFNPPATNPAYGGLTPTVPLLANEFNEVGAREYLAGQKWPHGLQDTFCQNLRKIPLRFFICDDSGSMIANDGHRLMDSARGKKMVACTRWDELVSALKFHAGVAKAACARTEFRLLNGSAPITIGVNDGNDDQRYQQLMQVFENGPSGGTPLCKQIKSVIEQIRPLEAQLRSTGQKVMVMIASDGESSDGDIVTAMQPLRSLPVWVVVRLCTDEDRIVDYWNNIDNQLELDMDVLDDLSGEAAEVYAANPWLTYGEPMHRMREFGIPIKEIDLMDTTALSADQIRRFCVIIFGGNVENYPHPELDWSGFIAAVEKENNRTSELYNPMTRIMTRWVNVGRIRRRYGPRRCCIS